MAEELSAGGAEVVLWQQDLRAPDLAAQFRNLIEQHGPINTLVNNAAVFYPEQDKVGSVTPELWQDIMAVNCHASFVLMQEFAAQFSSSPQAGVRSREATERGDTDIAPSPNLSPASGGEELNIINILDQRVLNISHAFPAYTASKSALWALTKSMVLALAPHIRVNAIAPGHVLPTAGEDDENFHARRAKTPLGTGPAPEDIAAAVEFILNSPSMTGACIPLDGGEHLVPKRR